jgi:hypothetical protein
VVEVESTDYMSRMSLEDVNPDVSTFIQIQRRVHVDQAHVGKPDFPTSTCGEVCGLAYYLRLWVFESCQVACDYLVNISFGCAESDLSREGSKWRSPGTQVTVRRQ